MYTYITSHDYHDSINVHRQYHKRSGSQDAGVDDQFI